jgi:hypothetical protein
VRADARSGDVTTGSVAIALGAVTVATFLVLLAFFVWGGVLGPINDAGNALIGILSAVLAILLHRAVGSLVGTAVAVIGAAFVIAGSWMVLTATTGFVLAGFVSSIGFGLIGLWLASVAWSSAADGWPPGLRRLGRVAAALMVIGATVAVPGALMGVDDYDAMPPWLWLFSLSWIGTYLVYPAWAIGFGRRSR